MLKIFFRVHWGPLVPIIEARVACTLFTLHCSQRAPVQSEELAKLLDIIYVCAKHRTFVFLSLWIMLSLII